MPLTVIARIVAKPGEEERVKEGLKQLTAASRNDPGCSSYELLNGAAEPAVFFTIERWADQAALDAHMKMPHLAEAVTAIGDALAEPLSISALEEVAV